MDGNSEKKSVVSGEVDSTRRQPPNPPTELLAKLQSTDWKERGRAAVELSHYGTKGVAKLVDVALGDLNETVRGLASGTLGKLCDPSAIPLLVEGMVAGNLIVKEEGLGTLGNMIAACTDVEMVQRFENKLDGAVGGLEKHEAAPIAAAMRVLKRRAANKKDMLELSCGKTFKPPRTTRKDPQRQTLRS